MLSVQVWTNGARILTCRDRSPQAIADLRRAVEYGQVPTDTGEFISQLAERLVNPMDDLIGLAETETELLGQVGGRSDTGALVEELAGIRRRVIRLGRYLGPQRRTLSHLATAGVSWLTQADRALLHVTAEQTAEYEDSLRSALEIAEIKQDGLLQRSSEKTEQRAYALTLISAVFMPLSFVTGLFGVNLSGIPDAEEPLAFAILCAALVGLVVIKCSIRHTGRDCGYPGHSYVVRHYRRWRLHPGNPCPSDECEGTE